MSPLKGRPTKTDGPCESKASIVGQDFSPGLNCRAFSHDVGRERAERVLQETARRERKIVFELGVSFVGRGFSPD